MSVIDRIAEDHAYLLSGQDFQPDGHEARLMLSKTIDEPLFSKTASFAPSRMMEIIHVGNADQDVHQDDDTGIFWKAKKGHIVRLVPKQIKG